MGEWRKEWRVPLHMRILREKQKQRHIRSTKLYSGQVLNQIQYYILTFESGKEKREIYVILSSFLLLL